MYISRQTQRDIRTTKRLGYTPEAISKQYNVSLEGVDLVLSGLYAQEAPPNFSRGECKVETGLRMMKDARRGILIDNHGNYIPPKKAEALVKHNWCDAILDWREDE